jgi:hypothetical protein
VISCNEAVKQLWEYLDGTLEALAATGEIASGGGSTAAPRPTYRPEEDDMDDRCSRPGSCSQRLINT